MADIRDALRAEKEAQEAIHRAELYAAEMGIGERDSSPETLLAGIAVAKAVLALGVRLDFVAAEARRA